MSDNILLRPIKISDNPAMAQIIREVMTEFGTVGEGYSINDPEVDQMYEAYDHPKARFYVFEKGGRVLGGGGIAPLEGGSSEVCELKKMYFYPELRGLGLGKKLLIQCLDAARELGYEQCYLETVVRMEKANVLYQKMGFRRLENAMGCTGHSGCDAWYVLKL